MPLKPIKIDPELNVYDAYHELRDTPAGAGMAVGPMLEALHETFQHFKIKPEKYRDVGNLVLRFSIMMGEQDEQVILDPEDDSEESRKMHYLADIYEEYNRRVSKKIEDLEDGQHRHKAK